MGLKDQPGIECGQCHARKLEAEFGFRSGSRGVYKTCITCREKCQIQYSLKTKSRRRSRVNSSFSLSHFPFLPERLADTELLLSFRLSVPSNPAPLPTQPIATSSIVSSPLPKHPLSTLVVLPSSKSVLPGILPFHRPPGRSIYFPKKSILARSARRIWARREGRKRDASTTVELIFVRLVPSIPFRSPRTHF